MHPLCHLLRLMRSALRGVMHFFGSLLDVVMHSFGGVMHLLGDLLDVFLHPLVGTLRFLMRPLGSTLRSTPLHELKLALLFGLGLFHEIHFVRSVGPANLVLEATVPLVEIAGVLVLVLVSMAVALPALFAAPLHVKASHGVAPVMVMVMLLRVMVMLLRGLLLVVMVLLLLAVALDAPATQVMLDAAMHPLCHLLRLMRSALRGVMHFFGGFLDVMMHLLGGLLDVVMHSFGGVMHLLGGFLDVFLHPLVSTLRSAPLHELKL